MKKFILFLMLKTLVAACAVDESCDIPVRVDAYLSKLEQKQAFSGSVLIAMDGDVILRKGYGYADGKTRTPNTSDTRHRISWVTAQFTAMAIMQLQSENRLDVQDQLCKYIPECPDHWKGITLHHLLTHTSGVADEIKPWTGETDMPGNGLERLELIKHTAPYFQPGEQFRYSGNGYITLGAIIEVVSNQTYIDYLSERILKPLGMEDSGLVGTEISCGYDIEGREVPDPDVLFRYSATGMFSTVDDLYLWDQALYGDELLSNEYRDTMFTGFELTPSMDFKGARYGYGWFVGKIQGRPATFHGGGMSGYFLMIMRFPTEKASIIVLRNQEIRVYDRLEIELAEIVFGD